MTNEPKPRSAPRQPGVYPMTFEQEALWLDEQLGGAPSRYLEPWACRLVGQLDVQAVTWSIGEVVRRHEVLRSRLILRRRDFVQVVSEASESRITQRSCAPAALPAELSWIASQPLDLKAEPMRSWLLRLGPTDHVLVVQFHHAVVDDWALAVFEREFREFYRARVLGTPVHLDPLPMQVGDYAIAQRAAGVAPADLAYWAQRMRDVSSPSTVPPDRPRPQAPNHDGGQLRFVVSPELGRLIRRTSRAMRATPFTVFAAAMAAVLRRQSGQPDVIFGVPVSRRGPAAVDGMIGCLSDLLPLRLAVGNDSSLASLIGQAKTEVLGAMAHKNVPYAMLLRRVGFRPGSGAPPLCPTALVVDDDTRDHAPLPGLTAGRLYIPPARAKFDLCLTLVLQDDGGYVGMCDYAAELYDAGTAARVTAQFTEVLSRGIAAPQEPLSDVLASRPPDGRTLRQACPDPLAWRAGQPQHPSRPARRSAGARAGCINGTAAGSLQRQRHPQTWERSAQPEGKAR